MRAISAFSSASCSASNCISQSREGIEEQLGNVGQSDSVAAGDTSAGELLGEIAEEEIHGKGGGEVIDPAEKVGGEDLGLHEYTIKWMRGKELGEKEIGNSTLSDAVHDTGYPEDIRATAVGHCR
jgi:hypothetical protein